MSDPPGSPNWKGRPPMLLLISHYRPRLGAVLGFLSSLAFIAVGAADHSKAMLTPKR